MQPALFIALCLVAQTSLPAVDIGASEIRALAEEELTARYPDAAHQMEVRVKRVSGTFASDETLRLAFTPGDEVPRGTTQVNVLAGSDRIGWKKAGWALLDVAHFDSVVVARAILHKGEAVTPDVLAVAWMETTAFRGEPLRPAEVGALSEAGALFATRTVREGHALRRADLRAPYAAETGDVVVMRYRRRALVFELSCKARESGHLDDEIRLYSADTGRTYRARLTETGTADWIETL